MPALRSAHRLQHTLVISALGALDKHAGSCILRVQGLIMLPGREHEEHTSLQPNARPLRTSQEGHIAP